MAVTIEGLIHHGRVLRIPNLMVRDGRELGLWWEPPDPGCRAGDDAEVRAFDVHYTGAENPAHVVVENLRRKALSTSFTIEGHVITQHADLATITYDSGKANGWTRGVEVICRGTAPPLPDHPRVEYIAQVHRRAFRFLRFTPAEMNALDQLAHGVCAVFGIPWRFPVDEHGSLLRRELTPLEKQTFTGVLGHFHLSSGKIDPGPQPLLDLMARASLPSGADR